MANSWQQRQLSHSNEDELTDELAVALRSDAAFRHAYERVVLAPLPPPAGAHIETQEVRPTFADRASKPDLKLVLEDGRCVVCEHKIKAPEMISRSADGQVIRQLGRYLELQGVDALAYFRPTWREPPDEVLFHGRYLRPVGASHFLWRHLYGPLSQGSEPHTDWLRANFEHLGFTPAHLHVGAIDSDEKRQNFEKLWDAAAAHTFTNWRREQGQLSTLFLTPRTPSRIEYVMLRALYKSGTVLRTRIPLAPGQHHRELATVKALLSEAIPKLPAATQMSDDGGRKSRPEIYLDVPLAQLVGGCAEVAEQGLRLLEHVRPITEALA